MYKFILALWCVIAFQPLAYGEEVPPPADENIRHYLSIPPGGLAAFLKRPLIPIPMISHHRGGPVPGLPENSIEAMDNALKYGYGFMEVDVAQLKDDILILMHDDTLDRTTTRTGSFKTKTWPEIESLHLKDNNGKVTTATIPTLRDTLLWARGKTILTLDIKRGTNFKKVAALVEETGSKDYVAAIAYTIEQAISFHGIAPDMPLSIGLTSDRDIEAFDKSGIPDHLVVAWTGTSILPPKHYSKLHARGWRVIMGTLGRGVNAIDNQIRNNTTNLKYSDIIKLGADIIATDRFWAVNAEINNPNLLIYTKQDLALQQ